MICNVRYARPCFFTVLPLTEGTGSEGEAHKLLCVSPSLAPVTGLQFITSFELLKEAVRPNPEAVGQLTVAQLQAAQPAAVAFTANPQGSLLAQKVTGCMRQA